MEKTTSKFSLINKFMHEKLSYLQHNSNLSSTKAMLANMRRGIGKTPGDIPELWGMLFENLDESMISHNTDRGPSWEEWAFYISLTMLALHQQGKSIEKEFMHKSEENLGKAIRKLAKDEETENRILRKFNVLATSNGIKEVQHHLRGIIQLLSASSIPLDYTRLAYDLYRWQMPDGPQRVRLQWGQDYYINNDNTNKETLTIKE